MTGDTYKLFNLKSFLILGLVVAGIAYGIGNTTYVYRSVYVYPKLENAAIPAFYDMDTVVCHPNDICRFYFHQTPIQIDGLNYIRKEVKVSSAGERAISDVNQLLRNSFPDELPIILETKFIKTSKEIRHALGWLVGCLLLGIATQFIRKLASTDKE